MNVLFVLCMMVLDVLLALYLVRILHEPVWLSGLLFALNTVAVAGFQTPVWALFQHRRPVQALQLSAAVWGLSFLMMWLIAPLPGAVSIAGVFLAVIVFTMAELIQGPVFNGLVVAAAPEQFRGRYMAVYQLSWALARAARWAVRLAVHRTPGPALDRPSRRMRGVRADPRDRGRPGDRRSVNGG